jgi:hypothetical protein
MKAFPTAADNGHSENQDGMDLRDYFAAKAMQSLLTHEHLYLYDRAEKVGCEDWNDYVSETAYFVADQMMRARK